GVVNAGDNSVTLSGASPDTTGYHNGELVWLTGTFNSGPVRQLLTVQSIAGSTITFTSTIGIAMNGSATTLSTYYTAGNGGTVEITSHSQGTTAAPFSVNLGATANGVNGTISATGFNGGTISLNTTGKQGVEIFTNGLNVATSDVSAVPVNFVNFGGAGGNIA